MSFAPMEKKKKKRKKNIKRKINYLKMWLTIPWHDPSRSQSSSLTNIRENRHFGHFGFSWGHSIDLVTQGRAVFMDIRPWGGTYELRSYGKKKRKKNIKRKINYLKMWVTIPWNDPSRSQSSSLTNIRENRHVGHFGFSWGHSMD